jgi:hypothetical protein
VSKPVTLEGIKVIDDPVNNVLAYTVVYPDIHKLFCRFIAGAVELKIIMVFLVVVFSLWFIRSVVNMWDVRVAFLHVVVLLSISIQSVYPKKNYCWMGCASELIHSDLYFILQVCWDIIKITYIIYYTYLLSIMFETGISKHVLFQLYWISLKLPWYTPTPETNSSMTHHST